MKNAVSLLFFLPAICGAADWQPITTTSSFAVFVDASSIARTSTNRKAWIRMDYTEPQNDIGPNKTYFSGKHLIHFDCAGKRLLFAQDVFYGENGNVVELKSRPTSPQQMTEIPPESFATTLLDAVCAKRIR